jgi:5-methylcytosine-specific restriction enzyme A
MSPHKAPRPCAEPGCPELTQDTRCKDHARQEWKRYDDQRGTATERGYGATWQKIRERKLSHDPFCEPCKTEGRKTLGQMVHHELPIAEGGTHAMKNLVTTCYSCHERLHDRRTGEVKTVKRESTARDGWVFA